MRYLQQTKEFKKVSIDTKDKKILLRLAANSRESHVSVGKNVGLTHDTVRYRIQRLENEGVIQGYRTVVDISKFNFCAYHLFIQLYSTDEKKEKEFIAALQEKAFVRAILTFGGKYDYEIAYIAKSPQEADAYAQQMLQLCAPRLKEYAIMIITESYAARTFPLEFGTGIPKKGKFEKYQSDDTDIKLLQLLSTHATEPIVTLAQKAKVSADVALYRLRKMQASGIIRQFIPVVNYAALSFSIHGLLIKVKNAEKLRGVLSQDPNILWAVKCLGTFDAIVYVCVSDIVQLQETISAIRNHVGEELLALETLVAFEEYKYELFPEYHML